MTGDGASPRRRDIGKRPGDAALAASPDVRDSLAVPLRGETEADRRRRDGIARAVLDASGH